MPWDSNCIQFGYGNCWNIFTRIIDLKKGTFHSDLGFSNGPLWNSLFSPVNSQQNRYARLKWIHEYYIKWCVMQRRQSRKDNFNTILFLLFLIINDKEHWLRPQMEKTNKQWMPEKGQAWNDGLKLMWWHGINPWGPQTEHFPNSTSFSSLQNSALFPLQSLLYFILVSGSTLFKTFGYSGLQSQGHPWTILLISHLNYVVFWMLLPPSFSCLHISFGSCTQCFFTNWSF